MKNYLLTKDLIQDLIYGTKANKEKIVSTLENLFKKNESLFISINCLNHLLENEIRLEKRKIILKNINHLCEKILPVDKDDLPLALGIESEFNVDHFTAMELIIAKKYQIDCILDITEKFKFQKMVSVVNLVLKTE